MRLLLCTPQPVTEGFGISRILIRLGERLERGGHSVRILGPEDLGVAPTSVGGMRSPYGAALRAFVRDHGAAWDVVEHDQEFLPFPRAERDPATLFVARSVLLVQWQESIRVPERRTLKSIVGNVVRGRARQVRDRIRAADATIRSADLVNVANHDDASLVIARGVARDRVVVIPYALADEVRSALGAATRVEPPADPVVAFIGTFDYRKGALTFGPLLERVLRDAPSARLKLLGCKGLFQDEASVRSFFTAEQQSRVEVVMSFARADLPKLLADCRVGVFPSHVESFGLGVLEMMSARLPVVAFDAPGPGMMVPRDLLVPRGDAATMATKVVALLGDEARLRAERARARAIAERFTWDDVARRTADAYESALRRLPRAGRGPTR